MTSLDDTFSALANPTRRGILTRLAVGEATVGELAEPFRISLPAISRHLRVLEAASLIERERRGKHRLCRLDSQALAVASQWLDSYREFWSESPERLDAHLRRNTGASNTVPKKR